MKYCKLRIAWTVFCGLACVLLIVLRVRSYYWNEMLVGPISASAVQVLGSTQGKMDTMYSPRPPKPSEIWHYQAESINKCEDLWGPSWDDYYHLLGFGFRTEGRIWLLAIPYWFLVFGSVACSALPWLNGQFRLRALLIAITLSCVGAWIRCLCRQPLILELRSSVNS
jgi:hypothetical protein